MHNRLSRHTQPEDRPPRRQSPLIGHFVILITTVIIDNTPSPCEVGRVFDFVDVVVTTSKPYQCLVHRPITIDYIYKVKII